MNPSSRFVRDVLDDDPFLTCEEVAAMIRVAPTTVQRWAKSGRLAGVQVAGRGAWRFRQSVVREVLKGGGSDGQQHQDPR